MKLLILAFIYSVVYIISNVNYITDGQRISDPNRTFQIFDFDYSNRGAYNTSDCLNDLLNCWEVVRGDVICAHGKYRTTICDSLDENMCSDFYGRMEKHTQDIHLFEAYCKEDPEWPQWTK